jgi:membrane protease YdiL (CAAX protease family)
MRAQLKSIVLPLSCLMLGMAFFFVLRFMSLPPLWGKFIGGFVAVFAMLALTWFFVRYEKTSFTAVNLKWTTKTPLRIILGLIIGAAIIGLMLWVLSLLTESNISRLEDQTYQSFFWISLVFVPLALMEEILFRGYPFVRLSRAINIRWVVLITAVFFALYHYTGSESLASLLLGPGVWGVVYATAAYYSKGIALPLGIHISANFMLAAFGLKPEYDALWVIDSLLTPTTSNVHYVQGIVFVFQLCLLAFTWLILEWIIRLRISSEKA